MPSLELTCCPQCQGSFIEQLRFYESTTTLPIYRCDDCGRIWQMLANRTPKPRRTSHTGPNNNL